VTLDEWLTEETERDPEFSDELRRAEATLRFGIELARFREERGLTQRALAERAGIKQPQLARIERGQIPTVPTLARLAGALNITFEVRPEGLGVRG